MGDGRQRPFKDEKSRAEYIEQIAQDFDQRIINAADWVGMTPDELIDLAMKHHQKVRAAISRAGFRTKFGDTHG